jgi:cell division protein FtsW (lipid II flippase)
MNLLRAIALAQLVVAAILWDKDRGIALVFVAIAVGLALPHTPSKRQKQRRYTRGSR